MLLGGVLHQVVQPAEPVYLVLGGGGVQHRSEEGPGTRRTLGPGGLYHANRRGTISTLVALGQTPADARRWCEMRKMVVMGAAATLVAWVLACPVTGQSREGSGIGLAFPVDWEASTVQVRRTHSEEWKRYVGALQFIIPIPLFLFMGPQTDVY